MAISNVLVHCELLAVEPIEDELSECCILPSLVRSIIAMSIGGTTRLIEQRLCVDCGQPN
jgi:hypothetical protein